MTAIELLKQDHDEAMMMIERLERVEQGAQLRGSNLALFGRLKSALTMHTLVEEQILYHSLANLEETKEMIKESYDGHRTMDGGEFRGEVRAISRVRRKRVARLGRRISRSCPV